MSAVDEIAAYLAHIKTGGNRIDQIIFDELPNGGRMTATDELRRLLDERGIEHMDFNMPERSLTLFAGDEHDGAYTENSVDTILTVYGASPEQAVEATLGRGTCHDTQEDEERFCCSECGSRSHIATEYRKFDEYGNKSEHFLFVDNPRFCPSCGRKVVDA